MIRRYKEIFFGLLLGLAMWVADALMHTMMPMAVRDYQPSLAEELLSPHGPQVITRLLFVGFALFLGWLLWRSNQRERQVRDLERRIAIFHEQLINPAMLVMDGCNTLLRSGGISRECLEIVKEIRDHARQIDDCAKDFNPSAPSQSTGAHPPQAGRLT
jgi:hypothetical protein